MMWMSRTYLDCLVIVHDCSRRLARVVKESETESKLRLLRRLLVDAPILDLGDLRQADVLLPPNTCHQTHINDVFAQLSFFLTTVLTAA